MLPQSDAFSVVSFAGAQAAIVVLVSHAALQVSKEMQNKDTVLRSLGEHCAAAAAAHPSQFTHSAGLGFSPSLSSHSPATSPSASPKMKPAVPPQPGSHSPSRHPSRHSTPSLSPVVLLGQLLQPPPSSGWSSRKSSRTFTLRHQQPSFIITKQNCNNEPGELSDAVIHYGCLILDICDSVAKRGDGVHKIHYAAYQWSLDSDLRSIAAGRGVGEAAWRLTCAAVLSFDPSSKTVTAEQLKMALTAVTRLNDAMFWREDTVKEGRAAAAVTKLRVDVQEKLQLLIGQSDMVVEKLVGSVKGNRKLPEDESEAPSPLETSPSAAPSSSRVATPVTDTVPSPSSPPSQPYSVGFIACTMLVLLQSWTKHAAARHPSCADIFANLALASRRCLKYGAFQFLVDETGTPLFGVTTLDGTVSPPGSTPLPDPGSSNWREWAVVLQHQNVLESLTTGNVGEASMTWMLSQLLTINTIKNDTQWLPEGFATAGYVFADISSGGGSAGDKSANFSSGNKADISLFQAQATEGSTAATAASRSILDSARERDFAYAEALGAGLSFILTTGRSTVESAVATHAPQPAPLHTEAENLRAIGGSWDCVRFAIGMEEGPGRRRRKLKLVSGFGDYSNAKEARDAPDDSGSKLATSTEEDSAVGGSDDADSHEAFASLNPLGFSPSKKRPSLSM